MENPRFTIAQSLIPLILFVAIIIIPFCCLSTQLNSLAKLLKYKYQLFFISILFVVVSLKNIKITQQIMIFTVKKKQNKT